MKLKFLRFHKVTKFKCPETEMATGKSSKCNKVLKTWYLSVYCVNCNLRELSFGATPLLRLFKICGLFRPTLSKQFPFLVGTWIGQLQRYMHANH